MSSKGNLFSLISLAISAFAIGTTEFISVGLLPLIMDEFHVSYSLAGWTVTLYALGVTVGAPVLTALTIRIPKKQLLILIMVVFLIANSLAVGALSFSMLLAARILSSFSHGVFMSIGSTIAADIVAPNKRASAIAIMFTGVTLATVTGVPIGTFIGQTLGWRAAFVIIVAIGLIALITSSILIPSKLKKLPKMKFTDQFRLIKTGPLLLVFVITALGYGGTFVVFTYLSPLLETISGYSTSAVALILFLYGIAIAVGNTVGGKVSNANPMKALIFMFLLQAISIFLLYFTTSNKWAGLLTIVFMGLFAFMNVPGLQLYAVLLAERFVPESVSVASAVNIAAFNGGVALGSFIGGLVVEHIGLINTTWIGALMVLSAAFLSIWSYRLERQFNERMACSG
ncbi:MFS transporter [Sporolactobacillus shoreicorticis]|uniref:MFS transporter n=1 Tax=Sporolactobacillus shoreicorticis TaxID=1923877 RepID=A0ABW5S7I6_9BACL|nr:MFS transporter [Sporolactobacillus shoreicorticis]MCO7126552.1 MFS transporter [Sporolactobacillus shoreicorticis]